jgi:hypothetical protein
MFLIILYLLLLISPADEPYQPSTFVFPAYKHTYGIRKAGPTELFFLLGFTVKFRDPQGLACTRLDAWEDPDDLHDDDELTVYGVNSGQNNIIFNRSMWKLGVYGIHEEDDQLLNHPHGICANRRGDVYVADTGNQRVVRLFNPGHQLDFVSAIGGPGKTEGLFDRPRQVALTTRGDLFVSDSSNNRIQVFGSDNRFKYAFTGENYLRGPNGLALTDVDEPYAFHKENFVIVIDSSDSRINKFTLDGHLIKSISAPDFGYPQCRLAYVCIDYHNQILITDYQNHCIHKLNSDLKHLVSFGRYGDDDDEFMHPTGITIYRRFGQLFVAEETGAQYYWVGTDLLDFKHEQLDEQMIFSFMLTEPSYLTADLLDSEGNFIMRLVHRRPFRPAGRHRITWNGFITKRSDKWLENEGLNPSELIKTGQMAPTGTYQIKISVEATYSSRTHFILEKKEKFMYSAPAAAGRGSGFNAEDL